MAKEKNNSRKKSAILVVLLLLLVVVIGGYTYSRYQSEGKVSNTADIAAWKVQISSHDLSEYKSLPMEAALTVNTNENVAEGKLAPGTTGTYKLVIDPTGSEVAIDYEIKADSLKIGETPVENEHLKITGAKYVLDADDGADTASGTPGQLSGGGVTINESLEDVQAGKKVIVEVTVAWDNDDANNESDTKIGTSQDGQLKVNTTVTAKQKIAED